MDFKLGLFHTAPTDFANHLANRHTRGAYKIGVHGRYTRMMYRDGIQGQPNRAAHQDNVH